MPNLLPFVLLSAFVWGTGVALFIQFTRLGRLMTTYLMWFVVATGCGVDTLLLLLLMDDQGRIDWWHMIAVLGVSAVPIAFRSIRELSIYFKDLMDGARHSVSE